uniref:Uncharacterized protein n=1 Tax=Acrobeloides nanus TaxID=290746 RepID=A0A914E841_9BILA
MDQEKQDNAVEWLEEALVKFTDANGKERKGLEICAFMQNKFQSGYTDNWMCVYSSSLLNYAYTNTDQEQIWFYSYQQFNILIFRPVCLNPLTDESSILVIY